MSALARSSLAVGWEDRACAPAQVAAAKVQVLHLEPIKARLGDRWARLSGLVHKLFEKALRAAQGPNDHFVVDGELSYLVTFHGLTRDEADIACAAVAQEVCEMLFGEEADVISVRSLVGSVSAEAVCALVENKTLAAVLEKEGVERLISPAGQRQRPPQANARIGLGSAQKLSLVPMWDLQRSASNTVFLCPPSSGGRFAQSVRRALCAGSETEIFAAEMELLGMAIERARSLRASGRLCALGVGVSYQTLSNFQAGIRYSRAVKSAACDTPFLLKIDHVPDGTPLGRLGEMVAMLQAANTRILVEFERGASVPALNVRLGAHGIGIALPENCSARTAQDQLSNLVRRTQSQKAFAFANGLKGHDVLEVALRNGIRFGIGEGLANGLSFTGLDNMPNFPLTS